MLVILIEITYVDPNLTSRGESLMKTISLICTGISKGARYKNHRQSDLSTVHAGV